MSTPMVLSTVSKVAYFTKNSQARLFKPAFWWRWRWRLLWTTGSQAISAVVLHTLLVEVEGILNSKPVGHVSSDVADVDLVTPNLLLMGQWDASFPQAVYASSQFMGKSRWRHTQILTDHFWGNQTSPPRPATASPKWNTDMENLKLLL